MLTRQFARTGWEVGVIGIGTWGLGGQWGAVEKDTAMRTVETALDTGVNFIDTADAYGDLPGVSEQFLSHVLRGRRDRVYIAAKVGNYARRQGHPLSFSHWLHVVLCCEASLHRLGTDYIDLYQCHIPDCSDATVYLEGFDRLVSSGKVRAFGTSTNSVEVARLFHRDRRCAAVQFDYSYLNRAPERDLLPYCAEQHIAAIVRGPLARGLATGKYERDSTFNDAVRCQWNSGDGRRDYLGKLDVVDRVRSVMPPDISLSELALRFVISQPGVTVAIPGARSPAQARQNARGSQALPPDLLTVVRQASAVQSMCDASRA